MSLKPLDPLLLAARSIILFCQALLALGGLAAAIAIPSLFILRGKFLTALQTEFPNYTLTHPTATVVALLLCAIAIIAMFWLFLNKMRLIVDSVADGDPFIPANSRRLTAMAWLMLAIQLFALPVAAFGLYFANSLGEKAGTVDATFDLSGIILVITLFILARVFRHGTAMREDLEGTV